MRLPWDDVRVFLVLCRSRTMGQAAARLGVDPSTVSRRLAQLEAALDTALFDRGRDGLRPTEAAEALLPAAELVEHGIARFAHAADGLEREIAGVVRMTCPPDVADVIALPVIARLLARHPGLRVVLAPSEAMVDLTRREADIALRVVRPTRGDLVVKRGLRTRWTPAASPSLIERLGGAIDLRAAPWIGWGERLQSSPPAKWLAAHAPGEPVLRTDSLRSQISAAAAGMGVGLIPAPSLAHYGLAPLDPAGLTTSPPPGIELYLVTHRALRRVPRIAAVWEALDAHLATLEAPHRSVT